MGLIANDLAGAEIANKSLAGVASAEGIDVVYQKAVVAAVGTTNYAPFAQALIASGANTVYEVRARPTPSVSPPPSTPQGSRA